MEPPAEAFYSLLGLSPSASPEQIKRAYRRLALKLHPDKNSGSSDAFQRLNTAYSTLSDPRKRKLYDRFGEQGVTMMEQAQAYGVPSWMLDPLAQSSLLLVILASVLALFVVMPILGCMRADGAVQWPWPAVLTPVWLANAALLALIIASGARERNESSSSGCAVSCARLLCMISTAQLKLLLFMIFEVLLAIKLQRRGSAGFSYSLALLPLTLIFVLGVFQALRMYGPAAAGFGAVDEAGGSHESKAMARGVLRKSLLWLGLELAFVLMLGAKLDGLSLVSWWEVMLPVWGMMALFFVRSAALLASSREHAQQEERAARRALAIASIAFGVLASVSLLLLSLRLASVHISAANILTPYFVVVGLLACCMMLGCLVGAAAASAGENESTGRGGPSGHSGADAPMDFSAAPSSSSLGGGGESDCLDALERGCAPPPDALPSAYSRSGSVEDEGGAIDTGVRLARAVLESSHQCDRGGDPADGARAHQRLGGSTAPAIDDVVQLGQLLRSAEARGGHLRESFLRDSRARRASESRSAAWRSAVEGGGRTETELRKMPIRELKEELRLRGVSSTGILEKNDLIELLLSTNTRTSPNFLD